MMPSEVRRLQGKKQNQKFGNQKFRILLSWGRTTTKTEVGVAKVGIDEAAERHAQVAIAAVEPTAPAQHLICARRWARRVARGRNAIIV